MGGGGREFLVSSQSKHFAFQGGGIAIYGGNVAIDNSQIYSNTAVSVSARLFETAAKGPPQRPDGVTDVCVLFCFRRGE